MEPSIPFHTLVKFDGVQERITNEKVRTLDLTLDKKFKTEIGISTFVF